MSGGLWQEYNTVVQAQRSGNTTLCGAETTSDQNCHILTFCAKSDQNRHMGKNYANVPQGAQRQFSSMESMSCDVFCDCGASWHGGCLYMVANVGITYKELQNGNFQSIHQN